MPSRTELTVSRLLVLLALEGVTPNQEGMFLLHRAASDKVQCEVRNLCERDERFDWKWSDEA